MCKLERNLNRIGGIIGIILLTSVIMAMSSCICGGDREEKEEVIEECIDEEPVRM